MEQLLDVVEQRADNVRVTFVTPEREVGETQRDGMIGLQIEQGLSRHTKSHQMTTAW